MHDSAGEAIPNLIENGCLDYDAAEAAVCYELSRYGMVMGQLAGLVADVSRGRAVPPSYSLPPTMFDVTDED